MTDQEFESILHTHLAMKAEPSRESFAHALNTLDNMPVTKNQKVRYNQSTASSYIINNKITDIIAIWKSKRRVLVPSFLLLLFIGAFSLSPHSQTYDDSIQALAAQDETIEEPGVDDEDQIFLNAFDTSAVDDLYLIQNEI